MYINLKQTRVSLALTLRDVAEALNVEEEYLRTLEDDPACIEYLSNFIPREHASHYYSIYLDYLLGCSRGQTISKRKSAGDL